MIFDSLAHASYYRQLSPGIARGLAWLEQYTVATPVGRYDIDGNNVYALVQTYDTADAALKKFESHRAYLDIQYVAAGLETIQYAPLASLQATTEYNSEKDYLLYSDPAKPVSLTFNPGDFALFFPQDGHKPGCLNGVVSTIKKVVIKARV